MVWHGIVWQGLKRHEAITQNENMRKVATVEYLGKQEGFGSVPDFHLYTIRHLTHPSNKLVVDSTVTLKTMLAAGFEVRGLEGNYILE